MAPVIQKDGIILVTFTDSSYLESFYTSYQISHLENYPNFLVVAMDKDAYAVYLTFSSNIQTLDAQGYPVCYYQSDRLSHMQAKSESQFWSSIWFEKMAIKIKIIREALLLHLRILLFDSDVILMKDPIPPILEDSSYDIIAQKDKLICAGFMFVNPTLNSLKFLNRVLVTMRTKHISDQPAILHILRQNLQPSLRVKLLPEDTYSSGKVFFTSHQFRWDAIADKQTIIHNNYVLGYSNKLYRLKEMGLYNLDVNGEYSSNTTRFVMLDELFGEINTFEL